MLTVGIILCISKITIITRLNGQFSADSRHFVRLCNLEISERKRCWSFKGKGGGCCSIRDNDVGLHKGTITVLCRSQTILFL